MEAKVQFNVRIPEDLRNRVAEFAKETHRTTGNAAEHLLEIAFREIEKKSQQ